MKTRLKSLLEKHVMTYSDIGFGILGRNEAVIALKQLISIIKSKKLLSSVDKIKPGGNPSESLTSLIDWIKEQSASIYFRADKGKNYLGYTDVDGMKLSILAFPLDFLPELTRMDRKLANLALRTCYAFAGYHGIGEVSYGNRLYNEDWVYDGLHDTITHGSVDPSDEAKKTYAGYKETWESYEKDYPKYTKRFAHYSKLNPSISVVSQQLGNFICDYRLQFVVDSLKEMILLCHEKRIIDYSNEALEIYLEANEYNKDDAGDWIIEDGWPLTLEDRIMLVWGGESSSGEDYIFYEIEQGANSFAGEFGYTEYSRDIEIIKNISLDEIIDNYNIDRKFFASIEAMYIKFDKMRSKILHGELKNQMKDERNIRSHKHIKNLQKGTLFEYVH